MNICHQVPTKPCQRQARAEKQQVMKMVPRRPYQRLKGTVNQQPTTAQHKYGAELTSPRSQVESAMPN